MIREMITAQLNHARYKAITLAGRARLCGGGCNQMQIDTMDTLAYLIPLCAAAHWLLRRDIRSHTLVLLDAQPPSLELKPPNSMCEIVCMFVLAWAFCCDGY